MSKTAETFSPFDTADYLNNAADVAADLEPVLDEWGDDPAVIGRAFGTVARLGDLRGLAREIGMSRKGLNEARCAGDDPSFATVRVAHAFGMRLHLRAAT